MREYEIPEELEKRKAVVNRNGYQCGVGTVLDDWQYREAVQNKNYVISWILQGNGGYQENGTEYLLQDGFVCMRRPGREYVMKLHRRDGIRLYLTIPQDTYPAIVRMIPELEQIPPVWRCPYSREQMEEFCAMYDCLAEITSMELYIALPKMIRYILHLTGIQNRRESDPLAMAKGMLEDNLLLPLDEIAGRCGMKYNTFRKRFAERYGMSPGQYRIHKRVETACRMLTEGRTIGEVAVALGYADVYSFTHQFTAVKGISPGRYRGE